MEEGINPPPGDSQRFFHFLHNLNITNMTLSKARLGLKTYLNAFINDTDDQTLLKIGREILGEDDEDVIAFVKAMVSEENEDA